MDIQDKIKNDKECSREQVRVAPIQERMVELSLRWFGQEDQKKPQ